MYYFTKDLLIKYAKKAIRKNLNRQLDVDWLRKNLDNTDLFPITYQMVHNDHEMRCRVALGLEAGQAGWLDIPLNDVDKIPVFKDKVNEGYIEEVTFVKANA